MAFKIVRNDITKVEADIIVNTANQNQNVSVAQIWQYMKQQEKKRFLQKERLLAPLKEEILLSLELIISTQNILFIQ